MENFFDDTVLEALKQNEKSLLYKNEVTRIKSGL